MSKAARAAGLSPIAAHLLLFLSALIIAGTFIIGALITDRLDPRLLTLVRFLLAVLLFLPWMLFRFGARTTFTAPASMLLGAGAVSFCLVAFFLAMFYALRYTTALNTSVIYTLVPALSCLFSFVLTGERQSLWRSCAYIIGLVGALWVLSDGTPGRLLGLNWGRGDGIFALGCVGMGLYTPLIKRFFHRSESMEVVTWWILVCGCGWLLLAAGGELRHFRPLQVAPAVWLGILYLVLLATILTFYFIQVCVPVLGAARVVAWSYTYPALVLLYDLLLGHPMPPPAVLPGVGIVCLSMAMLMTRR